MFYTIGALLILLGLLGLVVSGIPVLPLVVVGVLVMAAGSIMGDPPVGRWRR